MLDPPRRQRQERRSAAFAVLSPMSRQNPSMSEDTNKYFSLDEKIDKPPRAGEQNRDPKR